MFECMDISEGIYEGVVTPSYKKTTQVEANHTGLSRNKRVESASYNTRPAKDGSSDKCRKQCVDCSKSAPKTCIIHGPVHSFD